MIPTIPPDSREDQRFGQKLRQNVAPLGADGHAQADFAGALGDADQHDVHDADAADQQRDSGDGRQQQRQGAGGGGEGAGDIGQIADVEIVVGAERDVMAVAQQGGHLGLRALGMRRRNRRRS